MSTARALQNDLQQATGVNVSAQTISNRLHEGGLRARRPVVGPVLTRGVTVWDFTVRYGDGVSTVYSVVECEVKCFICEFPTRVSGVAPAAPHNIKIIN